MKAIYCLVYTFLCYPLLVLYRIKTNGWGCSICCNINFIGVVCTLWSILFQYYLCQLFLVVSFTLKYLFDVNKISLCIQAAPFQDMLTVHYHHQTPSITNPMVHHTLVEREKKRKKWFLWGLLLQDTGFFFWLFPSNETDCWSQQLSFCERDMPPFLDLLLQTTML